MNFINYFARNHFLMILCIFTFSTLSLAKMNRELTLLYTNDMHARVTGVDNNDAMCTLANWSSPDCFGGFARIYSQVKKEKDQHKNALVLDAGDQFQGSMFHVLYQGLVSAELMNHVGYNAMAVGNHELDHGPSALKAFANKARFPILSVNMDVSKSPELRGLIKPYIIVHVNDLRVGVIGYTTEETTYLANPGPNVKFLPPIPAIKNAVATLKKANVDVIIAVSHSGLNKDIEVASKVDGIAAIICGHSNSLLSNSVKGADGPSPLVIRSPNHSPVLLLSAYAYGKYLGKMQFSFDRDGRPISWHGDPILLDSKVPRDETISRIIESYYGPIAEAEKDIVGHSLVDLDGHDCRFNECIFGNLITDAMLDHGREFGVEIALMNGGGIRASIPKGLINSAQLKNVLPFDKTLVYLKLRGSVIKNIIEHGVAFADDKKNDNTGRFLQVAGLSFSFDPRRSRGNRVNEIFVVDMTTMKKTPLNPKNLYSVVTNDYLAEGGDNFSFLDHAKEYFYNPIELKELLAQYFRSPVSKLPIKNGRIFNLAETIETQ